MSLNKIMTECEKGERFSKLKSNITQCKMILLEKSYKVSIFFLKIAFLMRNSQMLRD